MSTLNSILSESTYRNLLLRNKLLLLITFVSFINFAQEEHSDLDSINKVLNDWNEAINKRDYIELSNIYSTSVIYYLIEKTNQEVLESKRKALVANPEYHQSITNISIEYPAENTSIVRCVFKKTWNKNNQEANTQAVLELDKYNDYKIIKESDNPTELTRFVQIPAVPFDHKKYRFIMDFWQDTRESEVIAHDFIAYYLALDIDNTTNELSVGLNWYSGAFRFTTDFLVRRAQIEGGFLKVVAAPLMFDEDEPEEDAYQNFTFKRIKGGVVLIENDGWFEDSLPIFLSIEKE